MSQGWAKDIAEAAETYVLLLRSDMLGSERSRAAAAMQVENLPAARPVEAVAIHRHADHRSAAPFAVLSAVNAGPAARRAKELGRRRED